MNKITKSNRNEIDLDKPQYNSTLKLIHKLDQLQYASAGYNNEDSKKTSFKLEEQEIERINEKCSSKLNARGNVFEGLVSVEPDQEDFLKYLGIIFLFVVESFQ